jgi:hypothetical protein
MTGSWLIRDQVYLQTHQVHEGIDVQPGLYLLVYRRIAPGYPGRWRCTTTRCRDREALEQAIKETRALFQR